jgi:hypothetical protein
MEDAGRDGHRQSHRHEHLQATTAAGCPQDVQGQDDARQRRRRIDLYYFGRGHTNGDAFVVFPAAPDARQRHFLGQNLPLVAANNGGSALQISGTLSNATNQVKNIDTIITGHSDDDRRGSEGIRRVQQGLCEQVRAAKAGKTVDQVAASWKMPAKYAGYAAPRAARLKANVQIVFDESK